MKILAIGNSFSEDATAYLYRIAAGTEKELFVVNLYIGGCSLEMHAANLKSDAKAYKKFVNTDYIEDFVSIAETLRSEKWDIVTVQQVSQLSGMPETYEPFAGELLTAICTYAPQAKICFHQTWAYENDSTHSGFVNYDRSQKKMFECIRRASRWFCSKNHLDMIPCGEGIQAFRALSEFDYENGGQSLCRDGFHLDMLYGRYAAGAIWFQSLTGMDIRRSTFIPVGAEPKKIELIKNAVHSFLEVKHEIL